MVVVFVVVLVGVVVIVGALTFFPAYFLGPLLEHLLIDRITAGGVGHVPLRAGTAVHFEARSGDSAGPGE